MAGQRFGEKGEVLFGRQAADMADDRRIVRDGEKVTRARGIAAGEKRAVDSARYDADRRRHSAVEDEVGDAFARRDHVVAQVAIAERQLADEPFHRLGVLRDIVTVKLVTRVIGEDGGNLAAGSDAQRRIAEQERVMRMDDVGFERIEFGRQGKRDRKRHREVAAGEVLYGGDADDVFFVLRHAGKCRRNDENAVTVCPQSVRQPAHRACDAADMRGECVCEHDDVHWRIKTQVRSPVKQPIDAYQWRRVAFAIEVQPVFR
jgi:predicted metalloprotease